MAVKLHVVQGRPQGQALFFPEGEYLFGRGAECHIRPNSDWVSRQHCLLRVARDALFLRDLGSRNGTLVNGERLRGERRLDQGDLLQVGPLVFQVDLQAAPPASRRPGIGETTMLCGDTAAVPVPAGADAPAPSAEPTPVAEMPAALPPSS